ncbi:hypothetical protein BDZ97DRAFT_1922887 [Flammula alnicola]|nr:hypothetical protein BDZ97DRAFT_1922887 [Flammula alnicola]
MGSHSEQYNPDFLTPSVTLDIHKIVDENSQVTAYNPGLQPSWIQEQIRSLCSVQSELGQKMKNLNIKHTIFIVLWTTLTLGLLPVYYAEYRAETAGEETASLPPPADTEIRSWKAIARDLIKIWTLVCKGGLGLCPLSLTMLQIHGVTESTLARTSTIAACVCGGSAFLLSAVFISMRSKLNRGKIAHLWVEASPSLSVPEAVIFWTTLVSPMSYLIWSILFCVLTLLVVSWNKYIGGGIAPDAGNSEGAKPAFIISGVFLTTLIIETIVQVRRAIALIRGNAAREATVAVPHPIPGNP